MAPRSASCLDRSAFSLRSLVRIARSRLAAPALGLTVLALAAPPASAQVKISQVYNFGGVLGPVSTDYVELYNPTGSPVMMTNWAVQVALATGTTWSAHSISGTVPAGGYFLVSFPNFLHLPWLVVRILAEKLNRPNWVVLQPIDKIYTTGMVQRLVEGAGFKFVRGTGSNYAPPLMDRLERPWVTKFLNRLGLWRFSFHPILVFQKAP